MLCHKNSIQGRRRTGEEETLGVVRLVNVNVWVVISVICKML